MSYTDRHRKQAPASSKARDPLTLFLAGDVMTGRGIDQVLSHSVDPRLYESYVRNAERYVELAEQHSGSIPDEVSYRYVWGEALDVLTDVDPDIRIINLETAVTTSDKYWRKKHIHYRMHPGNASLFAEAGIDICVLANNHTLDWGYSGLRETLSTLSEHGLETAGAGINEQEAVKPVAMPAGQGRLLVFAYATPGSGVPLTWSAGDDRAGINMLPEIDKRNAQKVISDVASHRRKHDRVVVSLHWGGNWGYRVPSNHRDFARRLIDAGAADLIHGHSSHHPKGIEIHNNRLILYGCGDLINDYEGISGHEQYRGDLALLYFPRLNRTGVLDALTMIPMKMDKFRLHRHSDADSRWLAERLDRECSKFDCGVTLTDGILSLQWG